jgi:ATP synthase protein I
MGWEAMQPGDVRILRAGVLTTAAVGVVVMIAAGLLAGWSGVYGALLGTALAMAFFAVTIVVVSAAARIANELMLPAALGTYLIKVIGIALALFFLRDTTAFDRKAFALATVIGACVFMVAELRFALRARTPYVTTPEDHRTPGSPRTG